MKEYWQTLIEFIVMSITVFGLLYIEVIVYLLITLKDCAVNVICGC